MATVTKDETRPKPYEVRWSWYDANGARSSRKKRFLKQKEAEAWRRSREQAVAGRAGQDSNSGKDSVEVVGERWFLHWQQSKRPKPSTVVGYRRILDQTLIPQIGHLRIDAVSPGDVDDFLIAIAPGRTAATVQRHFGVLRQVLKYARRRGLIVSNPALDADLPNDPHDQLPFRGIALSEVQIEDLAVTLHANAVRAGEAESPYPLAVRFMAYLGLRAGEMAALTIGDIRLPVGDVHVRRTLQKQRCTARCEEFPACREPSRKSNGEPKRNRRGEVPVGRRICRACRAACDGGECCWIVSTPKNRQDRHVSIWLEWLCDDLASYLAVHPHGPNGTNTATAPLFPGRQVGGVERFKAKKGEFDWDRPWSRDAFYKGHFKPAVKATATVPDALRLHDLRHTAGSQMLDAGMKDVDVAAQLGHSLDILRRVYAHQINRDPAELRRRHSRPRPKAATPLPENVRALRASS